MKEKINKIYEEKEKIVNKMRKPKTTKLLDEFQTKYRNEMHISYKDQLR